MLCVIILLYALNTALNIPLECFVVAWICLGLQLALAILRAYCEKKLKNTRSDVHE